MVLSLHVPLWDPDFITSPNIVHILQYAARIVSEGVPIFLTINGMLLLKKSTFSLKQHCKKMLRIFAVFLLWGILLVCVGCITSGEKITVNGVFQYIILTVVGSKYTGVLWFLQNLLGVYLIFPLLWYTYTEHENIFEYFFWIVFVFAEGVNAIGLVRDIVAAYRDVTDINNIINAIMRFSSIGDLWYVFYFCLGGMIWKYREKLIAKRKKWIVIGVFSWIGALGYAVCLSEKTGVLYSASFNYSSLFMLLFLLGLFALFLPYQKRNNLVDAFIASIGKNTFGIYLSHCIFIFTLQRFWTYSGFVERLIAFCIVFASSYVFTVIINRIPGLCKIIQI